METIHGPGYCPKCRKELLIVDDVLKCIWCGLKDPVMGNASTVEDPGEAELERISKIADVTIPISKTPVKVVKTGTIEDAIQIMKVLPMPDDVKQFKQIKKIIGLMEQLINRS